MKTRPLGNPFDRPFMPFHRHVIEPTEEQKARAVAYTKEAAGRVIGILRDLDLPLSAFDSVLRVYAHQEWLVVERGEIDRQNAEETERAELITKLRAVGAVSKNGVEITDYNPMGSMTPGIPVGGIRREPGYTPAMYDGLDMADIDELRELAKQHVK